MSNEKRWQDVELSSLPRRRRSRFTTVIKSSRWMIDISLLLMVLALIRDESYAPNNTADFFTDEVMRRWNDLMPVSMGFAWVNDTGKYHGLPVPIMWPDKMVFTTSATHQLHCLTPFAIVETYLGITAGHEVPRPQRRLGRLGLEA
ncbi:hypothetical protein F5X99DRAFT_414271 [Biscogniauxia marginata]|nr:hypothetical protein F5X99DRAFT_414271 [Biscogniauxia marginata]